MSEDSNQYTEKGFWDKLNNHAKKAGSEVVEKALQLYYAADSPDTPTWAKTVIYGALVYLIAPLDLIPDFIPVGGFTDDLGILAGTLAAVVAHITPEIKKRASEKLDEWFG